MLRVMLGCAAALLGSTFDAGADVIRVPADEPTLQAALGVASAGDEIVIAAGDHFIGPGMRIDADDIVIRGETGDPADVWIFGGPSFVQPFVTNGQSGLTFRDLTFTEFNGLGSFANGTVVFSNCVFVGNPCRSSGSLISATQLDLTIEDCGFYENTGMLTSARGTLSISAGSLTVRRSVFRDNSFETTDSFVRSGGGAIRAGILSGVGSSVLAEDCVFESNAADVGGAIAVYASAATVRRCRFVGNRSSLGGSVYVFTPPLEPNRAFVSISDSEFSGNTAELRPNGSNGHGGAAYSVNGGQVTLANVTMWSNAAAVSGHAVWSSAPDTVDIRNSLAAGVPEQTFTVPGGPSLEAVLVGTTAASVGITNPDGPDGMAGTADDDLSLLAGSPAIDAGNNGVVDPGSMLDIAGRPRFRDDPATADTGTGPAPIVDLGAHEFQPASTCGPADLAEPLGQLTFADITAFLGAFTNQDGPADLADPFGQFTFADINAFLAAFAAGCP